MCAQFSANKSPFPDKTVFVRNEYAFKRGHAQICLELGKKWHVPFSNRRTDRTRADSLTPGRKARTSRRPRPERARPSHALTACVKRDRVQTAHRILGNGTCYVRLSHKVIPTFLPRAGFEHVYNYCLI